MRVPVLYISRTISFRSSEVIEYGIVDESKFADSDIVVLGRVPDDGVYYVRDVEKGWLSKPAKEFRDRLLILSGIPHQTLTAPIYKLSDVKLEKSIPAEEVYKAIMKRVEELRGIDKSKITPEMEHVEVAGYTIRILRFKPAETMEDVDNTIANMYSIVTASRKRVFIASPVIVKLVSEDGERILATTLPRALPYIWDNPPSLVAAGIFDTKGFKAPLFIVGEMYESDVPDIADQQSAVMRLTEKLAVGGGVTVQTRQEQSPV